MKKLIYIINKIMKKIELLEWQSEMLEKMKKWEDIEFHFKYRGAWKLFFMKFLIRYYPELFIKYFIDNKVD